MTVAFVFAGQGVDPPWVAEDIVSAPSSKPLLEAASEATGHDIAKLLVRGGPALVRTEVLQPAMVAACLMVVAVLAEAGIEPDLVCGHSLGELAAWSAGGHVAATDAITASAIRGRLMAREAARHPGGMAAVSSSDVDAVIAHGNAHGTMCLAAENTVEEHVVSGDEAALRAIAVRFRARRLVVPGAWHSQAMAGAVDELAAAFEAVPRSTGRARFVANFDGAVTDPALIPRRLAGQLIRPIRWLATTRTLAALAIDRYVIAGPGKLVRALIRSSLPDADVRVVESLRAVSKVLS